jgi:hypothetical protein
MIPPSKQSAKMLQRPERIPFVVKVKEKFFTGGFLGLILLVMAAWMYFLGSILLSFVIWLLS